MYKYTLKVEGMKCEKCEAHVNDLIKKTCNKAKKVCSDRTINQTTFTTNEKVDNNLLDNAFKETNFTLSNIEVKEVKTLFQKLLKK